MIRFNRCLSFVPIYAALLMVGAPLMATAAAPDGPSAQKFVNVVAATDLLEVNLGKLALEKSQNHQVRLFAHWMIFDHSHLQEGLEKTAASENLDVPSSIPADVNKHYKDMAKLSGKQFDQAYAQFNVKGHEQAIALLKKEKTSDNDTKLSELADSALPVIEGHLIMAKRLNGIVDGSN